MTRIAIPGKYASESGKFYSFDFASQLEPTGDTALSASVSSSLYSGIAGTALTTTVTRTGSIALVAVGGGDAGNIYDISVTVVTAGAQHLQMHAFLPILPDQP